MTDEEFNLRIDKLTERNEALHRSLKQRAIEIAKRDKELEAIGAQLASINTELEALAKRQPGKLK
jgi:hypothetical protein